MNNTILFIDLICMHNVPSIFLLFLSKADKSLVSQQNRNEHYKKGLCFREPDQMISFSIVNELLYVK